MTNAKNVNAHQILRSLRFRGLPDIVRNYRDILGIDLRCFDVDFHYHPQSNFQAKSSFDAMRLIAQARNEIAHKGLSGYKVVALMDSWYPFDFVRRWVNHFDANFDMLLYNGQKTNLIREYEKCCEKMKNTTLSPGPA